MKEEWLLAASLEMPAEVITALYGKRFTIEENVRDEKDWRFGLGAFYVEIERTDRRQDGDVPGDLYRPRVAHSSGACWEATRSRS